MDKAYKTQSQSYKLTITNEKWKKKKNYDSCGIVVNARVPDTLSKYAS